VDFTFPDLQQGNAPVAVGYTCLIFTFVGPDGAGIILFRDDLLYRKSQSLNFSERIFKKRIISSVRG